MQTTILYIGRDTEITAVMNRLLNARPEWKGICVCTDDEAISIFKEQSIDLVLLGNGIDPECEEALRAKLLAIKPEVKIIQHYGGGSGLLYGEIMTALNS
ncbi:response regulator [Pedobacter jamesrossensis]|uniref:Response regulator receiver domain-containing protein n=1 Tax=Pedobacter jamesrossensis TaxID=1908238 RepID=A0ABV8NJF6_9SPHI